MLADVYALRAEPEDLDGAARGAELPDAVARVVFVWAPDAADGAVDVRTYARDGDGGFTEDPTVRGMHPMMAERMDVWRLREFDLERLPSAQDVYLFRAVAHANPRDERLVALAEVRDLTPVRDESGRITALPELERMVREAFEAMRTVQARRPARKRLHWNRLLLYAWPPMEFAPAEASEIIRRFTRTGAGLGLEMVQLSARMREDGVERDRALRIFSPAGRGVAVELGDPPDQPLQPLDEGAQRIITARRRGSLHPAEIVKVLAPQRAQPGSAIPAGEFVEHDLDDDGRLVPVDRPPATNRASIVVGLVRNRTERHPEGMRRVVLLGDPTRSLGSLAEPECERVIAALDLAEELGVPVEWFAVSSGREDRDGLRHREHGLGRRGAASGSCDFTQAGGEINIVVSGINVGAQPYWNAEATMLMHTKGILVMTPESAMVLTGKQALDYSGGVSAEDNFGIGGYERVMGPNGQAQYWAPDLAGACETLLAYYERTYVAPGERFPRRAETSDPIDRDVRSSPHELAGSDLTTVGEIFSDETNPGRKKPFDVRAVMRAVDRRRPGAARALGGPARGRERRRVGRAPRRAPGGDAGHRVAPAAALRPRPRRRPGAVERRHAVPAVLAQDRAGDQRRVRPPAAGRARQPRGLRRLARVDAAPAARVRRRDRPRDRQLRRPDRLLRDLPLPRRRLRRLLAPAQRPARDERARGRARVGDRRRARRRRRVRPRGRLAHARRRPHHRARRADRRRRGRRARAPARGARRRVDRGARREARRARERVRRDPQRRSAPSRSARSTASSPPPGCGRT